MTGEKKQTTQKLYQVHMPWIKKLHEKELAGTISEIEKKELKARKEVLFNSIKKFGYSLVHSMMAGHKLPADMFIEIDGELFIEFCNVLYSYDPYYTMPTTYFVRPFKGAISRYMASRNGKTAYVTQNWKKVNRWIQYYESIGTKWTTEMIASASGLSLRVVQSTLEIQYRSQLVDIGEIDDIMDQNKTPEEFFIEQERQASIDKVIKATLTPEEYKLLLIRLNLDGKKQLSVENVAKVSKLSLREVRAQLGNISVKLSQNSALRKLFNICEDKQKEPGKSLLKEIPFEDDDETTLDDILDQFKGFKF